MLFIEPSFLFVFLPLFLAAYYGALRFGGLHAALAAVIVCSFIFYSPYGGLFFCIFVASMAVNLTAGLLLIGPAVENPRARQAIMFAALVYDFSMLGLFQYANAVWGLLGPSGASTLID